LVQSNALFTAPFYQESATWFLWSRIVSPKRTMRWINIFQLISFYFPAGLILIDIM